MSQVGTTLLLIFLIVFVGILAYAQATQNDDETNFCIQHNMVRNELGIGKANCCEVMNESLISCHRILYLNNTKYLER